MPIDRPFAERDWRFGHYEMEGLQDPLSSFVRWIREGAMFNRKRGKQQKSSNYTVVKSDSNLSQQLLPTGVPGPDEKTLATV